ncbi:MAG: DUF2871 domain-containing protein [Turicibacter sp.]|nr:DUF2871 domain-containing protein [Turicibacter sp.]MBQ1786573.1 DUF2871 domain-containing protein [Turicibacter sp.]
MMKKLLNTAFTYTVIALVAGVGYREYTKMIDFTGETNLSLLHTHLFTLGMLFFLLVLALEVTLKVSQQKFFNGFFVTYNIGLILTTIMMAFRGFLQTQGGEISKAMDASVSGISGVGHILLSVGLVLFFISLKRAVAIK